MTLNAIYDKTIKRDVVTGKTLFTVRTNDFCNIRNKYGAVTCSGFIPGYNKGTPLRIEGVIADNLIEVANIKAEANKESVVIEYLSSGICSGLGVATATKIVEEFGVEILAIAKEPNAEIIISDKIEGFSLERALGLVKAIKGTSEVQEILSYISKYGGTLINAYDLEKYCGQNTLEKFLRHIYDIGNNIGMEFSVCDRIAKENGFKFYDKERVKIYSEKLLKYCTELSGHTYTTLSKLVQVSNNIEKRESAFKDNITLAMIFLSLIGNENVVIEQDIESKIYLKSLWSAENRVVHDLLRLKNSSRAMDFDIKNVSNDGTRYGKSQINTLNLLNSTGVKVITGGPGTGKTTTVKKIIKEYFKINPYNTISLCAPTGRAAQRLSESTGMVATTVHKLVEYTPYQNKNEFSHKDFTDPIESDMIVVDEMSMMDVTLMAILLGAVKNNTLLLLVGDVDQLPSVGAGNVLKDIINSNMFEVYELDEIFRQSDSCSEIIENAFKIKNGDTKLNQGKDFEIIRAKSSTEIQNIVLDCTNKYWDKNNAYNIQILSTTKKYEAGINNLNVKVQQLLNSTSNNTMFGYKKFNIGDKVMMLSNNTDKEYFNGDIGIVTGMYGSTLLIQINDKNIEMEPKDMGDVMLSYASTIHKSQGSEYPIVIIVLPKSPRIMLKRNLIYTAITRASKKVIIVSEEDALEIAINNCCDNKRNTGLIEKLNGIRRKRYVKNMINTYIC